MFFATRVGRDYYLATQKCNKYFGKKDKTFLLPAKKRFHSTKKGRKKSPRMRKNVLLDFNKAKT